MSEYTEKILLAHGSGGSVMHRLIREVLSPMFEMSELGDSAILNLHDYRVAFTTDSYVVSPIFFPGGNIGHLAINGTVNDLAVAGATPICLSVGLIIEEGLPFETLRLILTSMADSAKEARVRIVTGDTKVVERGKCDKIFINTAGIGLVAKDLELGPHRVKPGDRVLVSGMIGRHGIAVMAERVGLTFEPPVFSDTTALHEITKLLLKEKDHVRIMRDPTRGGVATTLKEIALESRLNIEIDERALPIPDAVRGACDLLGLDPLYVANEGILIAIVSEEYANKALEILRGTETAKEASLIGEVVKPTDGRDSLVIMKTALGGRRIVDMLAGEQLTRIC